VADRKRVLTEVVKERKASKLRMWHALKVCKHCHRVNLPQVRRCAECGKSEFEALRLLY